jgi:Domain of unknown function (DUF5071)
MPAMRYLLYTSESESSYTFVAEENATVGNLIPGDAVLVWQVDADSWEIACMKKNEFLGWEPYKPMITVDADLLMFLPRHKHDLDNFQLLKNLGYPVIRPVLPQLFAWVQDMNWPVARPIAIFLASLGSAVAECMPEIFDSTDGMWKYWVLTGVLDQMPSDKARAFIPLLETVLMRISEDDREHEVDVAARELLAKLRALPD